MRYDFLVVMGAAALLLIGASIGVRRAKPHETPPDTITLTLTIYREGCTAVDSMASIREGEQWLFLTCATPLEKRTP